MVKYGQGRGTWSLLETPPTVPRTKSTQYIPLLAKSPTMYPAHQGGKVPTDCPYPEHCTGTFGTLPHLNPVPDQPRRIEFIILPVVNLSHMRQASQGRAQHLETLSSGFYCGRGQPASNWSGTRSRPGTNWQGLSVQSDSIATNCSTLLDKVTLEPPCPSSTTIATPKPRQISTMVLALIIIIFPISTTEQGSDLFEHPITTCE